MSDAWVSSVRKLFPALARTFNDCPAVFLDGPAGTQVPEVVIQAISRYLRESNANLGGTFFTSCETVEWMRAAHHAVADFLGTDDPETVAFGPNMTTLNFALSRAIARTWRRGDEIIVTRLEHDSNFTPWITAAREQGVRVRYVDIHVEDCTLDLECLRSLLSDRTRLIAVGCASNATGTRNPIEAICQSAREVGALSVVDAVHFAPHERIDVRRFGCDFLLCSAYKFFGPHLGILWGRRQHLENIAPYKLRPAPHALPGRWMTGTQSHEAIAGAKAAVDYLATLGGATLSCPEKDLSLSSADRRTALDAAFERIQSYESQLIWQMIDGLKSMPHVKLWGITDRARASERLPTVAVTLACLKPIEAARRLAAQGFCVWHGNYYALPLTERLGLEPDGMLRIGVVHYNTSEEVDRFLTAVEQLS